ncbi:SgcJ/EcaC family oxidoreductase [Oceanobacillus rekensis]|uniref:SgcJ/EcaC family oxidoreductase n=1 Tax=Oceanobacillus rekensis TaxID=937927 RepID=UPI000B44011E|nr:SgcJ/EcaC family oxidoreductase [Oceanobacillus rekensis]
MDSAITDQIIGCYQKLINAWNNRQARDMANVFTVDGVQIGFDGSLADGREEIFSHISPIFRDHPTAPFVTKIKEINLLNNDTALLRAIAGMVPHGQPDIKPELNAHQTMVAVHKDGSWHVKLFQNTPAQFHGRPELVEEMTNELREVRNEGVNDF